MKVFKMNSKYIDLSYLKKEEIIYLKKIKEVDYLEFEYYIVDFLSDYFVLNVYIDKKDYIEVEDLNEVFSEEEIKYLEFFNTSECYEKESYYIFINFKELTYRIIEYIND